MIDSLFDVIIVGGASAGLTTAVYAARQNLKTLVITKDIVGQAILTDHIEITLVSPLLAALNKCQSSRNKQKASAPNDEVTSITEMENVYFNVKTPNGEYDTCALVLAFGKTPRDLGVPGEEKLKGKGVSYCAVCDGPLFKGKAVAIAGSGDGALNAAMLLTNVAAKVYLIHTWEKPLGDQQTLENLKANPKVEFIHFSHVVQVNGDKTVTAITVEDSKTKQRKEVNVEGIFVEIGHVAKTDLLKDLVRLNGKKEIEVDRECATSHSGIFAAGDITDVPFKQAVVSAGQGAIAALSSYNYVQKLRGGSAVRADWKTKKKA